MSDSTDAKTNSGSIVFYVILASIVATVFVWQKEFLRPSIGVIGLTVGTQSKILPPSESDFFTTVDVMDVQKDFVRMEGWVCTTEIESINQKLFVVLKNEQDTLILTVIPVARQDVADAFKSERYLYSGFKLIYPSCRIKKGAYRVGFLVEEKDIQKIKFTGSVLNIPDLSLVDCAKFSNNVPVDNVSLQDFYYRDVRAMLRKTTTVGYIGDHLPSPFYEVKSAEAQYSVAPTLVVGMRGEPRYDTLIGYFPHSRSIENPGNPMYEKRAQWHVMKDFENGILLLVKKN